MRWIGGVILFLCLVGCDKNNSVMENLSPVIAIEILPGTATVGIGQEASFSVVERTASGAFRGAVVATWQSEDPLIATVNQNGVVRGVSIGNARLSATYVIEGVTLNATVPVGVIGTLNGGKNITVFGKAFYEDKLYNDSGFTGSTTRVPIRKAVVHLIAIDGLVTLSSTQTKEDGSFAFNGINNSSRREGIYVEVRAETAGTSSNRITIVPNPAGGGAVSGGYTIISDTVSDAPGGVFSLNDIEASAAEIGGAFNVLDRFLLGGEFVQQACLTRNLVCLLPPLVGHWERGSMGRGGTFYETIASGSGAMTHDIFLVGGKTVNGQVTGDTDEYDDGIVLHEYGHFVATVLGRDDSPGGFHTIAGNDQDVRLSWSEGWATFFAAAVLNSPLLVDTTIGQTAGVFNIETRTDPRSPGLASVAVYTTSEVSISHVLWKAMRLAGVGFSPVWGSVFGMAASMESATMERFSFPFLTANPSMASDFRTILHGVLIEFDPDPIPALLVKDGAAQHHTLYRSDTTPSGDEDVISFSVTSGQTYTVKTNGLTNGADTYLTIDDGGSFSRTNDNADGRSYSSTCDTLCPKNNQTTLGSSITFLAPTGGVWNARVKRPLAAPPSTGLTGSYNITLRSP
jgi:hypothetical protein